MTKISDRYARWFGTRVPLVSRGGISFLTFFAAIPFSVLIFQRFLYTIYGLNFWLVIGISLLVGALVHILILLILHFRFRNPINNPEFLGVIGQVHQKVVVDSRTHIWARQSEDVFIATNFNPLYNAIIVSEPMMNLILKSPESGEVLMAFHLLRVPRSRWFGDLIGFSILFAVFTYLSSAILVPIGISIWTMISTGYYIGLMMFVSLGSYFLIPIIFILIVKGAFWRHDPAFTETEGIYDMHPQVAKVQVEQGRVLNEDEVQAVIYGVRNWEKNRRSSRRLGVSVLCAVPAFFLGYYIISWIGYIPYGPYFIFYLYGPFILPAVVAVVCYLLLRQWDKNAMGDVFPKTTDYDEPIWVD
jgi:hypothetical protein